MTRSHWRNWLVAGTLALGLPGLAWAGEAIHFVAEPESAPAAQPAPVRRAAAKGGTATGTVGQVEQAAKLPVRSLREGGGFARWPEVEARAGLVGVWLGVSLVLGAVVGIWRRRAGAELRMAFAWPGGGVMGAALAVASYVLIGWPHDLAGFVGVQGLVWAALVGAVWANKFGTKNSDATKDLHGSASWASVAQMRKAGRILKKGAMDPETFGFALGRVQGVGFGEDPRLRYSGHLVTAAPTGAGKGVSAVIPTLLEYPGSVFVLDVKGENYAVTAARRRAMGQRVVAIDPFGVTKGWPGAGAVQGCNWLDGIDLASPECVSEATALADLLVVTEGEADPYWNNAARDLLKGLILWAASLSPRRRHIGEVRKALTGGRDYLGEVLEGMIHTPCPGDVCERAANAFIDKADKESSSVLSMAVTHTEFLDDPRILQCVSRTDFAFADLKEGNLSVYLIIPPNKISAYSRFLRGFVGLAVGAMTASVAQSPWKVLFLLDEFAQLGKMKVIEDAIAVLRGYGVALWLFIQDLSQLEKVYPKADSLLANAAKQFFSTADLETAKYISGMVGNKTVAFESVSKNVKGFGGLFGDGSGSKSTQYSGRPLVMPEEVLKLGAHPVVLIQGESPYLLDRITYFKDPEYAGLASENPYHQAGKKQVDQAAEKGVVAAKGREEAVVEPRGRRQSGR